MSKDGSRIFFSDASSIGGGGPARQLYVRENGTDTTQISLSQVTGSVGIPRTRTSTSRSPGQR